MQQPLPKHFTYLGLKIQGDLGPFTCYTNKRGLVVWFLKAPPQEPPSWIQTHERNMWRYVGWAWAALTRPQRDQWEQTARRARLRITGYNLFTYFQITDDEAVMKTVEHQTGLTLPGRPICQ